MSATRLAYRADFSAEALASDLPQVLVPGEGEEFLTRWVPRLEIRFRTYVERYPFGLWQPGLVVNHEMRSSTELLLPFGEIKGALTDFCRRALRVSPPDHLPLFHGVPSWIDALPRLPHPVRTVNPARLLRRLAADERLRALFLFSLHIPARHGGGFGRYPAQFQLLRNWLQSSRFSTHRKVRCLDAACGTGEGVFELGILLGKSGLQLGSFEVQGLSLDPLEIFAAAHGYFPHDPQGEAAFRRAAAPALLQCGSISFSTGDVTSSWDATDEGYDMVLCNGLLGGPLLHRDEQLIRAVDFLSARLKPGGLLLAADHFHAGWGKRVPKGRLREMLTCRDFVLLEVGEGVAGIKKRQHELPLDKMIERNRQSC